MEIVEVLKDIIPNIEAVTISGVSVIVLINALTQAVKDKLPIAPEITVYIVGVVITFLAFGLGVGQLLAGLVAGFTAGKFFDAIHDK